MLFSVGTVERYYRVLSTYIYRNSAQILGEQKYRKEFPKREI